MTRRAVALALVRTPSAPARRLPRLSRPRGRTLAGLGVRSPSLGCSPTRSRARRRSSPSQRFEVTGAVPAGRPRTSARRSAGSTATSLVALDAAAIERRLAALPVGPLRRRRPRVPALAPRRTSSRSARWPSTATAREAWLVSASGRVIAAVEPTARPGLARIRIPEPARPGARARRSTRRRASRSRCIDALPARFPAKVLYAEVERTGALALVVAGGLRDPARRVDRPRPRSSPARPRSCARSRPKRARASATST